MHRCMQEHIDLYMAGALRQANIANAAREALLRTRTASSLEGSTGDDNEGEEDESVERETDLDEFRRWLESQPRGSQAAIPDPSSETAVVPSRPAIVAAASSPPEAEAVVPSPDQAVAAVPSSAEAVSHEPSPPAVAVNVPSPPEGVSREPSPRAAVAVNVPSPPEASSGSGSTSNTKQSRKQRMQASHPKQRRQSQGLTGRRCWPVPHARQGHPRLERFVSRLGILRAIVTSVTRLLISAT